jgi:hypothetical protein
MDVFVLNATGIKKMDKTEIEKHLKK